MVKTAVLWIRDGVLIDRMPINAVAFAVACLSSANADSVRHTDMTQLVSFAFETSGISCADKMDKFNSERMPLVADVARATDYYNALVGAAAAKCAYMKGAWELIDELHDDGYLNFITSAVDQQVMDEWAQSEQAQPLVPCLTEILAKRGERFNKGRDHFAHVRDRYKVDRILYVADAVSEISTGARFAEEFHIVPIGFAHVITPDAVTAAYGSVVEAIAAVRASKGFGHFSVQPLHPEQLSLPAEPTLVRMLKDAGALHIVSGDADSIMSRLREILRQS